MRIKAIQLSWFRGAADPVTLDPNCKSIVVYGANGSGKSSFVDAVEFMVNDGRIGHLAHEYSGRRQEKAIPNTHMPEGRKAELCIRFKDESEARAEIAGDGLPTTSGKALAAMRTWNYRRTILRQHEVAEFINDTKGGKYSALLPLLGLHSMEVAADNLRQVSKSVEKESKLWEIRINLKTVEARRMATFSKYSDAQIIAQIAELHARYCPDKSTTTGVLSRCKDLKAAIDKRVAESTADQRRYVGLSDVTAIDLKGRIGAVRSASGKLAGAVEPLILEKLEVLASVGTYVSNLGGSKMVSCPACGRDIPVDEFQTHVKAEQERLHEIINAFDTRKTAIGNLVSTLVSLKSILNKADLKSWRDESAKTSIAENFALLDGVDPEALRVSCGEEGLKAIENTLQPLIDAAVFSAKDAPPDAQQLSVDKEIVDVASAVIAAKDQAVTVARAETLISFINSLEQGIREEIKTQARGVIGDISADVQAMWAILHPGEAIEDVRLYLPDDADKAIDIGLKFHGVEQDSPRLTLSEGYRNSLGLCIFLAMAQREQEKDRPLFLDDVVVSLDREHRGLIAEILKKEFNTRQVILLTHDRDWYTDLRAQLDSKTWGFKILLPYETPKIGIRWSHNTSTFDDARAHLKDRPDSAGNDARKIMDVELSMIAEKLQIRVPFIRGEKNDKRMAYEYTGRLVSEGKKCFERRSGEAYEAYTAAIDAIAKAGTLLVSWGNRGSHTTDLVPEEANKLIEACEKVLDCFKCPLCGKWVWYADSANQEVVQCECGGIRWRYGKG